jgi:protocatechuate 3,4-dioxygenase beta subunit
MAPSARQAIACILFTLVAAISSQSQVTPAKTASASIRGKVTLKNKGLPGIVVIARDPNYRMGRSNYRGTTDQAGDYQITNLPPGTYQVAPASPGLVLESDLAPKSLVLDANDNVEDVNFPMARGGVITGKITDADGRPVIEEQVFLQPVDGPFAHATYFNGGVVTDDRGVYRAFGLRGGQYKVFVGQENTRLPGGPRIYRQTFYPSVTDGAKATLIEVTEGSEAGDVDIVMGRPVTAFKVVGRIVDSETGKPLPNIMYGIHQSVGEGGGSSTSGATSNANGEFRFDGVMPGKYSVFIVPEQNANIRAEWVTFEVSDRDVTGLVIKAVKASSVSGVVVLEGADDPSTIAKLTNLYIHAILLRREAQFQGGSSAPVGADGSFKINGLSPGVVNLAISSRSSSDPKRLSLLRIERDGVPQPTGVTIKDGEHVTGLRLIVKSLTASIRGQVKIEDGELPVSSRMSIWVQLVADTRSSYSITRMNSSPQIDSRGRFLIEGLDAGTYEINIAIFENGRYDTSRIFKQEVTVAENSVSEVTVMVKLKP